MVGNQKRYTLQGKGQPYKPWHQDNIRATEYAVPHDYYTFCGPIKRTYPANYSQYLLPPKNFITDRSPFRILKNKTGQWLNEYKTGNTHD